MTNDAEQKALGAESCPADGILTSGWREPGVASFRAVDENCRDDIEFESSPIKISCPLWGKRIKTRTRPFQCRVRRREIPRRLAEKRGDSCAKASADFSASRGRHAKRSNYTRDDRVRVIWQMQRCVGDEAQTLGYFVFCGGFFRM